MSKIWLGPIFGIIIGLKTWLGPVLTWSGGRVPPLTYREFDKDISIFCQQPNPIKIVTDHRSQRQLICFFNGSTSDYCISPSAFCPLATEHFDARTMI